MTNTDTNTGNYLVIAGFIASALAHWNIIISQDSIIAIIVGAITLYGAIHQLTVNKTGQTPIGAVLKSKN